MKLCKFSVRQVYANVSNLKFCHAADMSGNGRV